MVGSPSLTTQHCKPMPRHLLLLLTLSVALVAGCGSDAGQERASSSTDVNTLLRDTFRNFSKVKSANLTAKLAVEGQGQSVGATLSGPFESQGAGKLPKFQLDAALTSGAQSFSAGATWTGDKGFVNVQGTAYELSGTIADQLQAGYEEAAKQGKSQSGGNTAALLGVDFSKWLKNGRNAGSAQVGGTQTIKITGDADVARVVDDLQRVAEKAKTLNLPGTTQVPQKLTAQEREQIVAAVKKFAIEVYTGADDRILRRLVVDADLADTGSKATSHLSFDLTLDKVGDSQSFQEPENAKPFSELLKMADQLKGLGGALGAAAGSTGSGAGGSGASGAASSDAIEKYAKCVTDADGDQAKAQKCAGLLDG
jgi:hypothetical protein